MRVAVFDLDDTLAPSKSPVADEMARLLVQLLGRYEVCIISGGRFEQFEAQVLDRLAAPEEALQRLHLMPTCGTRYYRREQAAWRTVYSEDLAEAEKDEIIAVLSEGAKSLGLWEENPWGALIEDRGSQITFSALGQQAPVAEKSKWDPTGAKKESLREYAAERLPAHEVRSGGSTSIDVTRKGIDKAYGITRLVEFLNMGLDDLLFVGDRLDEGGNDYPVKALGVECFEVSNWHDTAEYIRTVLLK